ncbi:MAG: FemAB family XrtA/PEP-CTERM system-associated protein [Candidatus Hodarchaeota archaeon]
MIIEKLRENDEKAWEDFVVKSKEATFFHQIGWKKVVEKVYGDRLKAIYLIAEDRGKFRGILPLFLCNNWPFGRKLISLPLASCGGCCTDSEAADVMLINKAIELANAFDVDYLELRNIDEKKGDFLTNKAYLTLVLDLDPAPENLWSGFRETTRRYIRKATRNNLEVTIATKDIGDFYKIYSQNQRNLGTPVQSYRWIKSVFFDFPGHHAIARVRYQGKTIAAIFLRTFRDQMMYVFGASLPEYRNLYPNYILFWKILQDACKRGFKQFDFGRSLQNSGSYFFKVGWGAKPEQYYYQYYLNRANNIPDTSQANSKRIMFAKLWKRLPLPMANTLGPMIRRYYQ